MSPQWIEIWQKFLGDHITENEVSMRSAVEIAKQHGLDSLSAHYIYGWYMYYHDTFRSLGYSSTYGIDPSEEEARKMGWDDAEGEANG